MVFNKFIWPEIKTQVQISFTKMQRRLIWYGGRLLKHKLAISHSVEIADEFPVWQLFSFELGKAWHKSWSHIQQSHFTGSCVAFAEFYTGHSSDL